MPPTWQRPVPGWASASSQVVARRRADLCQLLPDVPLLALGYWIVMHESLRHTTHIRAAFNHLGRGVAALIGEALPGKGRLRPLRSAASRSRAESSKPVGWRTGANRARPVGRGMLT